MSFDGVRNSVDNEMNQLTDRVNQYSEYRDRFSTSRIANALSWAFGAAWFLPSPQEVLYQLSPDGYYFRWPLAWNGLSDITRLVSDFWHRPDAKEALQYVDQNSDEYREYALKFKIANEFSYISWGAAAVEYLTIISFAVLAIKGKMDPTRFRMIKNIAAGSRLTKYATRAISDYLRPGPIQPQFLTSRVSQNIRGQVNELETQFRQIGERNQVLRTQNARLLENRDSYIEPIDDSLNTNT